MLNSPVDSCELSVNGNKCGHWCISLAWWFTDPFSPFQTYPGSGVLCSQEWPGLGLVAGMSEIERTGRLLTWSLGHGLQALITLLRPSFWPKPMSILSYNFMPIGSSTNDIERHMNKTNTTEWGLHISNLRRKKTNHLGRKKGIICGLHDLFKRKAMLLLLLLVIKGHLHDTDSTQTRLFTCIQEHIRPVNWFQSAHFWKRPNYCICVNDNFVQIKASCTYVCVQSTAMYEYSQIKNNRCVLLS